MVSSCRMGLLGLLALAAMGSIAGCGDSSQKVLADAVYCKDVPVFKGATFDDEMGSESWGDEPGSYTKGRTWWFKTKASKDDLLAYYQGLYPNAEKTDLDDGAVQLRWVPQGARKYEDVTIVVDEGELRIGEECQPKTLNEHKKSAS